MIKLGEKYFLYISV